MDSSFFVFNSMKRQNISCRAPPLCSFQIIKSLKGAKNAQSIRKNWKQIMIVEVTEAVMNVLEEGRHKEENFRHEARRHWNGKNFNEERMIAKESYWIKTPEDIYVAKEKIKVLHKTLPPVRPYNASVFYCTHWMG